MHIYVFNLSSGEPENLHVPHSCFVGFSKMIRLREKCTHTVRVPVWDFREDLIRQGLRLVSVPQSDVSPSVIKMDSLYEKGEGRICQRSSEIIHMLLLTIIRVRYQINNSDVDYLVFRWFHRLHRRISLELIRSFWLLVK